MIQNFVIIIDHTQLNQERIMSAFDDKTGDLSANVSNTSGIIVKDISGTIIFSSGYNISLPIIAQKIRENMDNCRLFTFVENDEEITSRK